MALVNIGVQLAQAGRKVLLVDFDLEAPGLQTFSLRRPIEDTPGIVEYISHYIDTGESPDVRGFLYESETFPSRGKIWVMPVGKQDASYSSRLNSIDWRTLYAEQSGYLFFEDLKKQWANVIAPDYVLIDSRTGHSDVEGICTRQLPNAVTLLFFPNEQNLHGLKRIVSNITASNSTSQSKRIRLHFAVSNVPDLDDEDQILVRTMERFRKELGYRELSAEIHHYNSLALLNQEIFSLTHPNSRLAKEYKVLTRSISKYNLEDREAVLGFLALAHKNLQGALYEDGLEEFDKKLKAILTNFGLDGEVRFRAALVFEQLGSLEDALGVLSDASVDESYATAPVFAARARLYRGLDDNAKAVENLNAMLDAGGADISTFLEIAPLIEHLQPALFERICTSVALRSLSERDQQILAFQFDGSVHQTKAKISILRRLQQERLQRGDGSAEYLSHDLALALIGIGDFDAAIRELNPHGRHPADLEITSAFNVAMATWGKNGIPTPELFEVVVRLHDKSPSYGEDSPNYLECLAICHAVLRDKAATTAFLVRARTAIRHFYSRELSAWSYSKVSSKLFLSHLDEIEAFANGENVRPSFIATAPQTPDASVARPW